MVNARCLRWHHLKPASFPHVNSFCELHLMEKSTIRSYLWHPTKCWFQTPVSAVLDVERAKPDYFVRPLSGPPSLPGRPFHRFAHPLQPENIFSVSIRPPAIPSWWLASLPLRPCRPHCLTGAHARLPFWYVVSPYPPPDQILPIGDISIACIPGE